MSIAIIPARIGSKRVLKKNIKDFCGKPMISYAIEVAQRSELFEEIIVSTDSNEVEEIALSLGAKIPFKRPSSISDDITPTVPVIAHAIKECIKNGFNFNYVCCIYPCVPFLEISDLKDSFKKIKDNKANYCFAISEYNSNILRSFKINKEGKIEKIFPRNELIRTQDLDASYFDAGQFYWGEKNVWLDSLNIHDNGIPHIIPNWRAIDIDTNDDWLRAEHLYSVLNKIEL